MRKTILTLFMFIAVFFTAGFAQAEDTKKYGVYLEPRFLVGIAHADYLSQEGVSGGEFQHTSNLGGALALGYDFSYNYGAPVRAELEYAIRSNTTFDVNDRDVKLNNPMTVFANFYYDIKTDTFVTPYIGGGVGFAALNSDTNFAWNVGGGFSFDMFEDVKLNLGYRYASFGRFEDNNCDGLYRSHELYMGVRYTF